MMRCDEARNLLGRWYDKALSPYLAERVADHVTSCPVCAAEVARWRCVDDVLGFDERVPDLAGNVAMVIRQDSVMPASWWVRAAAAAVLALGLGGLGGLIASSAADEHLSPKTEVATLQALEASFGPEALAGIDRIAAQLSQEAGR